MQILLNPIGTAAITVAGAIAALVIAGLVYHKVPQRHLALALAALGKHFTLVQFRPRR